MKLFVFDVSNIFYRSFYGNERLCTSDGVPTQALHGFLRTTQGIMKDHRPDLVAFVMEGKGKTVRSQIEPLYKANRPPPPEDLVIQKNLLLEVMDEVGYPVFSYDNLEADDTIASIARFASILGMEVVIVSSDKDFNQLVSKQIKVFNLTNNTLLGSEEIYLKYGVRPDQFLDYLSIVGDTSDNVKGVQGIGPKGAVALLSQYGTLDGIYNNIDFIKGANKTKLLESKENAYKAKQLINFLVAPVGDLDLMTACKYNGPKETARALFRKYEFRELENVMLGSGIVTIGELDIGVRK